MKSILIITYSELHKDPRVLRQVGWLSPGWEVTTIGLSPTGLPGIEFIPLPKRLGGPVRVVSYALKMLLGMDDSYYWKDLGFRSLLDTCSGRTFDVIYANDYDTLPFAAGLRRLGSPRARLVFDAHEFSTRQHDESPFWRLVKKPFISRVLKRCIGEADARITVSGGIAREYEKVYGLPFTVVTNASGKVDLEPRPAVPGKLRIVLHGGAGRGRMIESLIDAMAMARSEFSLDLVLVDFGSRSYIAELQRRAAGNARIRFLPPVPFAGIVPFLNGYDIGVVSLPAKNFNQRHALPNKLFEFIQARLAIVAAPLPEIAEVVRGYGCGIVSAGHSARDIADALNGLDAQAVDRYKAASHAAAGHLCAEMNRGIFLSTIEEAAARP